MPSTRGIRAGRAFVELFADDSMLVRGLRRAEKRLKAFGDRIRAMGLMIAIELSIPGAPVVAKCLDAGLRINCTQETVLRMLPAMNVTKAQIDEGKYVARDGQRLTGAEAALYAMPPGRAPRRRAQRDDAEYGIPCCTAAIPATRGRPWVAIA